MARSTDAKCRLCRREGIKLFLKGERCYSPKCPIERKGAVIPGQHGPKRQRRMSEYGRQLREKQKAKRLYGILERQFKNYFKKASQAKALGKGTLLTLLERRLDNVVFRLGLAPSRSVGRQLVSHGHVLVEGKRVNLPSYQVKPGQTISLSAKGLAMSEVKKSLAEKERKIPAWLKRKAAVGQVARLPEKDEIDAEVDESLITEFYSR